MAFTYNYEEYFESAPQPAIVYCLQSLQILKVNEAATKIYGYTRSEFSKMKLSDVIDQADHKRMEAGADLLASKGKIDNQEWKNISKDGRSIYVEVSTKLLSDGKSAIANITDITKRYETDKQLKILNERLQYATKATSDIIFDWNLQINEITWGDTLLTKLGYHKNDIKNIQDLLSKIHPDDLENVTNSIHDLLSGHNQNDEWEQQYRFRKPNGSFAYLKECAILLKDEKGLPYRVIGAIEDATIRLKIEDKVKVSNEKYSLLFYKSPVPKIIFCLRNLQVTDVNEAAISQHGFNISQFTEKTIDQLIAKEDVATFISNLSKSNEDEKIEFGETNLIDYNNNVVNALVVGHRINIDGQPHMIMTCSDITEVVATKRKLEETNERYRYVMKATHDAVWDYDIATNELYLGDNFLHLFGYHPDEANQLSFWENNIHVDERESIVKSLNEALQGKETHWSASYRFKKKDGSYAEIEDQTLILRHFNGKAYRTIGAMRDVTERKENHRALKLMQSIVTNTTDAVLITEAEPQSEPGPKIVYANDAFLKNTGYQLEEVIGNTPRMLQGPKTSKKALQKIRTAMRAWKPCRVEVLNYTKEGKEFWVEFSISPLADDNGWYTHWISVQRDITFRKNKEAENKLYRNINTKISKPLSFSARYKIVIAELAKFSDFALAEGWFTNTQDSSLVKAAEYCAKPELKPFFSVTKEYVETKFGECLQGAGWESQDLIIWNDLGSNQQFIRNEEAKKYGLQTGIAIPIYFGGEVIGVVLLFTKRPQSELTEHKIRVLKRLGQRFGPELKRMKIEHELNTFFELSPDILSISDTKFFKKVNPAFCRLLGYNEEELLNSPITDFIHPDDIEKSKIENKALFKTGRTKYFENRYISKSGKTIWLAWTSAFIKEEQAVYAVAKDITSLKEINTLLQKSNELARIGNWSFDVISQKIYWSSIVKQIHEVDEDYEPLLENSASFALEGPHRNKLEKLKSQVLNNEITNFDVEVQIKTAKNNLRWVRVIGNGEYLGDRCIRFFGSIQDITQHKTFTEKLKETNIKYELASKTANIGIWDLDLKNQLLLWDKNQHELFETSGNLDENMLPSWNDRVHNEDLERTNQEILQAIKGNKELNTYFRIQLPSRTIKYLKTIAHVVRNNNGRATRLIGINYDITKEMKSKETLRKNMLAISENNKRLREIAWLQSHVVKAPLARIKGLSNLLINYKNQCHSPDEIVSRLVDAAQELDGVVSSIISQTEGKNSVSKNSKKENQMA
ncbi:PAS domain S-box protein [Fulvivirga sp. RKSG066]|uniref:PAS domain S-box protein n=1 Tax=Fulvivirga aurantia TaxID=2529383 RepID=UPI0012BD357E|nr:PAS domain S-box protein [Fulvivirga aurantia]MTI21561.1 PAS domain S-box protein [Fulvivirga aurantia]